MYNSTNAVVYFDEKDRNLYLSLPVCCQIRADNNSSTCAFTTRKVSLIDGVSVTIILCLHVLIAHHIFINFGYVDYFQLIWILKTLTTM